MNKTSQSKNIEGNSAKKRFRFIVAFIIIFVVLLFPIIQCGNRISNAKSLLSMNSSNDTIIWTIENENQVVENFLEEEKQSLIQNAITKYISSYNGLNIRNKNWEVINTLPLNTAITVLKEQVTEDKKYDLILFNDDYAYASHEFLKLQKTVVKKTTKDENKTLTVNSQKNVKKAQNESSSEPESVTTFAQTDNDESGWTYLGTFTSTAYCNCSKCCGKWAGGPTASGKMPQAGRTIAVDPKVIPLGSQVKINGKIYIAEDTGSAIKGKKIDIYYDSHSAANNWGRRSIEVYVL